MREALAQPTIARAFPTSAIGNGDRVAVREFGSDRTLTYNEWLNRARAVAGGLEQLGVRRGDRVALWLTNKLAGKNMSPAIIEQTIRGPESLIGQVVCFGEGRPYNVGLIALDRVGAQEPAAAHGLPPMSVAEMARHPLAREHLTRVVAEGNARLSRVERLKRFAIHEGEWIPGGDELTATSKLKRMEVYRKYATLANKLYTHVSASIEPVHVH
jgi:long-subunit acyl-CoA synthetase (AMP-forming)